MNQTQNVVCPNCQAINRVPAERLGQDPSCGKCHARLVGAGPLNLDTAAFSRHLAKSDLPLVVDFWATWCGPCRMMAPAFEQAAATLAPGVRLAKVNTEQEQMLASQLGIQSIPTMVLFQGGREKARTSGAMSAQDIVGWVQRNL